MKKLFDEVAFKTSKITTREYSTSFSLGIRLFKPKFRQPIYNIYGFVRFADEIVDTFHDYDKSSLFHRFREDTWMAITDGISMNPILHSFQETARKYSIGNELIEAFLDSMEMDLQNFSHSRESFNKYVLGSAEVVGLMCLHVFCEGNMALHEQLKPYAMRLGAAYQKINFLRDMQADYLEMGRKYFPGLRIENFNDGQKEIIEKEIEEDFRLGYQGIKMLPAGAKFGVYISYIYYYSLFKKIRKTRPEQVLTSRIRISNFTKYLLLMRSWFVYKLNLL
ncbi:MAG: phytoene/squalene synthase family protein [bacterium]